MLLVNNKNIRKIFGFIETFNLLTLKLLYKNKGSINVFPGQIYRQYMSHAKKDKWICKSIFDVLPDFNMRIIIEHIPGKGIYTPMDEIAYLAIITKSVSPTNIFEIGTFRGRTALNFALNSPDDCKVYTLDLPTDDRSIETNNADKAIIENSITGIDCSNKDVSHKITQLYGNSLEFDYSPYYKHMDIVFVDGAHHYEAVKIDTENALKMVNPGGYIVWHDFANYGDYNDVTRAVLDTLPKDEVIQIENSQLAVYFNK